MKKSSSNNSGFKLPSLTHLNSKYSSYKQSNNSLALLENKWKMTSLATPLQKHVSIHSALKSRKPDLIRNLRRSFKNPYAYQPGHSEIPYAILEEKYSRLASKLCNY